MNETKSISVKSFQHFKELTTFNKSSDQILFRGQNKDYDLKPGITRQRNRNNLLQNEKIIIENFKKRFAKFEEYKSLKRKTNWDFLILAQHYGLKTRLLDWTENPYVALWFATSLDFLNGYGVVWVFKVGLSKILKFEYLPSDPFSINKTIVFKPPHLDNHRIQHQSSWFSAHAIKDEDYSMPFDKQDNNYLRFTKLTIPISLFPEMRRELHNKSDISAETLYNSIDKMCEDINKTFAPQ